MKRTGLLILALGITALAMEGCASKKAPATLGAEPAAQPPAPAMPAAEAMVQPDMTAAGIVAGAPVTIEGQTRAKSVPRMGETVFNYSAPLPETAPGLPKPPPEIFSCQYFIWPPRHPVNTERYEEIDENDFTPVDLRPLSTFSIDVDTGSYSNVRRFLQQGQRPPVDAVRIEELLNYFDYAYAPPADNLPFSVQTAAMACPWTPQHRLVRIGLKGREFKRAQRPPANLVFLVDVSGSMAADDKLPLLLRGMQLLVRQLDERDQVGIVTYAGGAGVALSPTRCNAAGRSKIQELLGRLQAGGSTHGSAGIHEAYRLAEAEFLKDGANRVILCTDGDFNVGVTNPGELNELIEKKARGGVFLTVLGFGEGNLKDATMEQLADKGNGMYGYVDSIREARKLLVSQLTGSIVTIAKDVKIQVEFNPAEVAGWRLIGYENRLLADQDFNDDTKDAGEIGAGHTVTALYEIVPAGQNVPGHAGVDALKYQTGPEEKLKLTPAAQSGEMMTVKLRYKAPDEDTSKLITTPYKDSDATSGDTDLQFSAAVAGFGMLLRESPHARSLSFDQVADLARAGKGEDEEGYRTEFIQLVKDAAAIMGRS